MTVEQESLVLPTETDSEGITLYLKVNYKAILLVLVAFDVVHLTLAEYLARLLDLGGKLPL